jgi:hypothetical protein
MQAFVDICRKLAEKIQNCCNKYIENVLIQSINWYRSGRHSALLQGASDQLGANAPSRRLQKFWQLISWLDKWFSFQVNRLYAKGYDLGPNLLTRTLSVSAVFIGAFIVYPLRFCWLSTTTFESMVHFWLVGHRRRGPREAYLSSWQYNGVREWRLHGWLRS